MTAVDITHVNATACWGRDTVRACIYSKKRDGTDYALPAAAHYMQAYISGVKD